ncbi:MAG: hypothetical protein ACOVKS_01505, partial [Aquimonas sp.]
MRHRLLTAAILFALALPASAQTPAQPAAPTVLIPQIEQTAAAEAPPPGYANGSGRHTLNLKAADINVLIETVSEITGKSFIVDQTVAGAVTVVSRQPMTADEIYEVFLSVLRVHGYTAVPAGSMVKIVPDVSAAQQAPLAGPSGGDAQLTRIIDLKHV